MENRTETLRHAIDAMLQKVDDISERRIAFVHIYGVTQTCALLALRRDLNVELAMMAGMLHDFATYRDGFSENHAARGAVLARELLTDLSITTPEETDALCDAIFHHSDKAGRHAPLAELLTDADVLQHYLYNPTLPRLAHEQTRLKAVLGELGIIGQFV